MNSQSSLAAATFVSRCDGILHAEIDQEIVALSIAKGTCYGLNAVGSRVWRLLAHPIQVSTLCEILTSEYAVEPSVCECQVLELLEDLLAEGMIKTCESIRERGADDLIGAEK